MFRNLVANTIGSSTLGIALLWIILIKLCGLTLLVVRGFVEVRHSRLAVVGLVVVLLSYGTAILINELPSIQTQTSQYLHAALGNSLLVGCTAILVSVLGYARFVYLDANGLIDRATKAAGKSERQLERAEKKADAKKRKADARKEKLDQQVIQEKKRKEEPEKSGGIAATGLLKKRKTLEDTAPLSKNVLKRLKEKKSESRQGKQSARDDAVESSTLETRKKASKQRQSSNKAPTGDDYLMGVDDAEVENLSKSERRRLRKLKRRSIKRAA